MAPTRSADTIRILVATDSHVGFEERDPIRKDDSWKSFDEVITLARTKDVDMILLAGDLFHDNKPSRKSMYQVMRTLRQNCLGEKPCELEFLSDASDVFDGAFNHVNYEDPDINVSIPAFSIHGNHDDPSGDGHYCSLDLLQVSGLINYFGRTPESDKIDCKPILLQKGNTKLALYGMSNVRDERLFRTFRDRNVKFFTPSTQQKDWFNLMAVHQNHHAHNETGYLPENFLPEFMDLIVWGHEHECLIDPRLNPEMTFHVMQPGSSIATSLVAGEAVAKHVAILEVTGKEFKIEKHRIKSVRPFITRDIILATDDRFRGLAKVKDNRTKLTQRLTDVIEGLIEEAKADWIAIQDDEEPEDVPLPLVRLRVEYSAPDGGKFDCENPQRLSNRFVNKVANVNDVVQFHRKKTSTKKDKVERDLPDDAVLAAMNIDNIKVEKLVSEFLAAQSLKILPQAPFGDAVNEFIVKDDKHAMEEFVNESLSLQVKELLAQDEDEDDDLESAMERLRAKQEALFAAGIRKRPKKKGKFRPERPDGWDSDRDGEWENEQAAFEQSDAEPEEAGATAPPRRGRTTAIGSDEDNASVISAPAGRKIATTKRAPAKRAPVKSKAPAKAKAPVKAPTRGRKKVVEPSEDEDEEDFVMLDAPAQKSQPKRTAAAKGRQTQLNFPQPQAKSKQAIELSDDEISDDEDAFEPMTSSRR